VAREQPVADRTSARADVPPRPIVAGGNLWDDDWFYFGGPSSLQQAFLGHPHLGRFARTVNVDDADATPPGHIAI
jgi:hypothetical protein